MREQPQMHNIMSALLICYTQGGHNNNDNAGYTFNAVSVTPHIDKYNCMV